MVPFKKVLKKIDLARIARKSSSGACLLVFANFFKCSHAGNARKDIKTHSSNARNSHKCSQNSGELGYFRFQSTESIPSGVEWAGRGYQGRAVFSSLHLKQIVTGRIKIPNRTWINRVGRFLYKELTLVMNFDVVLNSWSISSETETVLKAIDGGKFKLPVQCCQCHANLQFELNCDSAVPTKWIVAQVFGLCRLLMDFIINLKNQTSLWEEKILSIWFWR